jgi:hypothetical protein
MAYRTQDGLADYGFSIEYESSRGWRVYIAFRPFYQGQDDGLQLPYQSIDGNGRCYVNWPEKLDGLGETKTVAALWAELAHRCQRSQEQHALYVEMIKNYQITQEKRRTTSTGQIVAAARSSPVEQAPDTRTATPSFHTLRRQQSR